MSQNLNTYTFSRLANKDEAFRIILFILINDPNYQMLPMRQIVTFYTSISNDNYLLLMRENKVLAVILWMGVSATVREACLREDRSPFISELVTRGDAMYCTAFAGVQSGVLLPLWKEFIRIYQNHDISLKRHFKNGQLNPKPITLLRHQKRVVHS
jgi:hemolysin-activating ACP:hemolysin acyltransferase